MEKILSTRRQFSDEQKAELILRHLIDKIPVSDVCVEYEIAPNMFYRWLAEFRSNASVAFRKPDVRKQKAHQRMKDQLESEIQKKDSIIAFVTTELMESKKKNGVI